VMKAPGFWLVHSSYGMPLMMVKPPGRGSMMAPMDVVGPASKTVVEAACVVVE